MVARVHPINKQGVNEINILRRGLASHMVSASVALGSFAARAAPVMQLGFALDASDSGTVYAGQKIAFGFSSPSS